MNYQTSTISLSRTVPQVLQAHLSVMEKMPVISSSWFCCFSFSSFIYLFIYFISKNDIYTKSYSMHEKHRANPKITKRRKKKKDIFYFYYSSNYHLILDSWVIICAEQKKHSDAFICKIRIISWYNTRT